MQPLTRTQKRQKETKERIFRSAMELFQAKGFEDTTVSEITERADIGKGTFFLYFPSKEAILRLPGEILMEEMRQIAQRGLSDPSLPVRDVIRSVLIQPLRWHEANREIALHMSKVAYVYQTDAPSNKGNLLELMAMLVASGQERGEFDRNLAPSDAAIPLAATYFMVVFLWVRQEERSLASLMEGTLGPLLRGLR